ncbi:murein hydrolase activator EnvC family protein [Fictibacillus fluitans]|uniref:Peptidoglycan DD-metalloendopeptidase family protein n=1 Tax=Fictibacillus fluitans TaxID=3058422 RepID=A0ABT8HZF4_9BACL|nr:M23 family metallopeptidase [Fictibacillus sp. NE201]MDN4526154.1 peptidoglycan DD-metalloendopeptidase family protein [Fictibacillus sp. NE201]
MNRKFAALTLSLSLALSGLTAYQSSTTASAETLKSIKEKKEANKKKQDAANAKLKLNEKNQEATRNEIARIDQSTADTENKISQKETEIHNTKDQVEQLKKEIDVVQKRIDKRDKLLKDRINSMYQSGGAVQYLEVVLGSKNFGDFLDRVVALNLIADQDRQLLEEQQKDKELLVEKKKTVEDKLAALEDKMNELQELKKQLDVQKKEKTRLMASLKKKHSKIEDDVEKYENAAELLNSQEQAIKEEKARAQQANEQQSTSGSAGKSASNTGSGMIMKPAAGAFTSGIGSRWNKFHAGVDIAQAGKVPIYAAADGTVIRSDYSSSYGNVIFVTHNINGQTWTTVYAHMRERVVQGGSVKRGQLIGYMGNTGHSFGQHLHFELHKGPWNASKSNAVDPRPYM